MKQLFPKELLIGGAMLTAMHWIVATITALTISWGASAAAQQEPISFKGFTLGGTMTAFKEKFSDFQCEGSFCRIDTVRNCMASEGSPQERTKVLMDCRERNTYGGIVPKSITATFSSDALVSVMVTFHTKKDFDELAAAMTSRFGKPKTHAREPVQNRMGATFENERLSWHAAGTLAILSKYTINVDEGSVLITSEKHLEDVKREQQDRRKKGAGDL